MAAKRPIKYTPHGCGERVVYSRLTLMAEGGGYCMVQHFQAVPFAMTRKEWDALPGEPPAGAEVYPARRLPRGER